MNKLFLIPFITFLSAFIVGVKVYLSSKKMLNLVKKIDYEKWNFLTSCSKSSLNWLIYEDWGNPYRVSEFIRNGDYFNDAELEKCVHLYKKYKMFFLVCLIAFGLSFPLMGVLSVYC